ncbi:MAG TPA: MSMEG_0565 family glycosyltransferase [Solirubrobacteraceae bacterium]|jgi:glycosyltransferase-like protein|nr:MSMEG_0565 family glycosyltransferase [Solirubrobacteraceae bacterium]
MRGLRIAMLTYSVRPRGGVVHAVEVAGALRARGHHVELIAIGQPGARFFRPPRVPATIIEHRPPEAPFDDRVAAMIAAYARGLRELAGRRSYDVVHAQDCVSAHAALALRDDGLIPDVLRTVHHVDAFTSPSLVACQHRSIVGPDAVVCVTQPWVERLRAEFGVEAGLVRNGVDAARYRPARDAAERERARAELGFGDRLVVLTVGGVEYRKGSVVLAEAFANLRRELAERDPLLVVAGGATLFDHRHEKERFARRRHELGLGDDAIRLVGSVSDERLELLYRAADVFAFPSVVEGFGLVVLEALAADLPVVVSDIAVLADVAVHERSALVAPAGDARGFGRELVRAAGDRALRARLRSGGRAVVAGYGWATAARAHERAYADLLARRAAVAA